MMTAKKNGCEQAFAGENDAGLTKREYIAAMCMASLVAACNATTMEDDAKVAVACADALLAQLNKE